MLLNFESKTMGANSYLSNQDVILLEEFTDKKSNVCKGITALNVDPNGAVTVTIKLGDAILVTQALQPREYITLNSWVVVNKDNPLKIFVDNTNVDFSIPMIIVANKVEL